MSSVSLSLEPLERILNRPQHVTREHVVGLARAVLQRERVVITGAAGSLGTALGQVLRDAGVSCTATDIGTLDVTEARACDVLEAALPTVVFHLAGAKHAPLGEVDPLEPVRVHIDGTANVLAAAARVGARVVTASTCKACDPETAYGATKLIAERMTLNAGGVVARFFNVVDTQGNVFELWESLPEESPVPYTPCTRHFISAREAVALLIDASRRVSGRYAVWPGGTHGRGMGDIARAVYPDRAIQVRPERRGDRLNEPLHAECETYELEGWVMVLRGRHDPQGVAYVV